MRQARRCSCLKSLAQSGIPVNPVGGQDDTTLRTGLTFTTRSIALDKVINFVPLDGIFDLVHLPLILGALEAVKLRLVDLLFA